MTSKRIISPIRHSPTRMPSTPLPTLPSQPSTKNDIAIRWPISESLNSADRDIADVDSFEARVEPDRHEFRFIVSPEDAAEIGDLRAYTRALMGRMEADLGTRLDWVAVDHWDTDNPHTQVVLRGVDATGENLVIARDYIAHGMRCRASELATDLLAPQTERGDARAHDPRGRSGALDRARS